MYCLTPRDGLDILLPKLARCISRLAAFAQQYKDLPTLGTKDQFAMLSKISMILLWTVHSALSHVVTISCRNTPLTV
jgi:adenylosuccinate lyase